jgi:peptide/nickel transport system permease protein
MLQLIGRRIVLGIFTLWLVSVLVFAGTELLPGDVAEAVLGQSATPENVQALRLQLGLDKPAIVRYVHWLTGMFHLDFGMSLASQTPVSNLLAERLGRTLMLAGLAASVAVPLALTIGLMAAVYPGSAFDRVTSLATLCVSALPEFFLATVLVLVFAVKLHWLPAISYVVEFRSFGQLASSLAMPVVTLAAVIVAQMARMTRATVVNVLGAPYAEMAMLKGVPRFRIVLVHAWRAFRVPAVSASVAPDRRPA